MLYINLKRTKIFLSRLAGVLYINIKRTIVHRINEPVFRRPIRPTGL